jgi:hypothetical protein
MRFVINSDTSLNNINKFISETEKRVFFEVGAQSMNSIQVKFSFVGFYYYSRYFLKISKHYADII